MRAYLTGGRGFAGSWLRRHLHESGDEVLGGEHEVDVTDAEAIASSLAAAQPHVVFHLAGLSHVGRSWDNAASTFQVNAVGTLNVLEAAARCKAVPRVVLVSSAEVYGKGAAPGASPGDSLLSESAELRPVSPYASSKVAAEFLGLQAYLGRGVPVVRVRPFNHVGPGQSDAFVVSALARRVAEAESSGSDEVAVGNLSPVRDFTDVRDVARAYRLVAGKGEPGEVYNLTSGRSATIDEVAHLLLQNARKPLRLVTDPSLVRPVDVPVLTGDASKLRRATGWEPRLSLEATLAEVLQDWRDQVAAQAAAAR